MPFRPIQSTSTPPTTTPGFRPLSAKQNAVQQPPRENFFKSAAKDMAKPVAQIGVNAYKAGKTAQDAVASVAGEGTAKRLVQAAGGMIGNMFFPGTGGMAGSVVGKKYAETGSSNVAEPVNVPGLGPIKAFSQEGSFGDKVKEASAVGAQLASTLIGGGGTGKAANLGLKGLLLKAAATEAAAGGMSGATYGLGKALEEKKGLRETLVDTSVGGGTGLLAGAVLGPVLPATGAVTKGVVNKFRPSKFVERRAGAFTDMFNSYVKTKKLYDKSTSRGFNVSDVLASDDRYIPEVIEGKVVPDKAIIEIQKDTVPMAKIIRGVVESEGKYIKIEDFRKQAYAQIEDLKLKGDEYTRIKNAIDRDILSYAENYGTSDGMIPLTVVDDIKKAKYGGINWMNPDQNAADRAVSKAARKTIEDSIEDVSIKELNQELGKLYDAQEMLEALGGRAVKGGRLGIHMARGMGAIAGSSGGPFGAAFGAITADKLATMLQSSYFQNPILKQIVGEIRRERPKIFEEAERLIAQRAKDQKNRLGLPAPSTIFAPEYKGGKSGIVSPTPIDDATLEAAQKATGTYKEPLLLEAPGKNPIQLPKHGEAAGFAMGAEDKDNDGKPDDYSFSAGLMGFAGLAMAGGKGGKGKKSPANIAKYVDANDLGLIRKYLSGNDYKVFEAMQPVLRGMGIDGLDAELQKRFLNEVIKESTRKLPVKSALEPVLTGKGSGAVRKTVATRGEKGLFTGSEGSTNKEVFNGFSDLSLKTLEKLKGKSTVSRQFIEDLSNQPDLKQGERDVIRKVLADMDTADPLVEEAGKYKSAEEFIKEMNPFKEVSALRREDIVKDIASKLPENSSVTYITGMYAPPSIKGQGITTKIFLEKLKKIANGTDETLVSDVGNRYLRTGGERLVGFNSRFPEGEMFVRKMVEKGYLEPVVETGGNSVYRITKKALNEEGIDLTSLYNKARGGSTISVPNFANKVKGELLPLKVKKHPYNRSFHNYENVTLPQELRGPVANYEEHAYQSPIKTSAGDVHFTSSDVPNYFGHTRIEDMADGGGSYTLEKAFDQETGKPYWQIINEEGEPVTRRAGMEDMAGSRTNFDDVDVFTSEKEAKAALSSLQNSKGGTRRVIEVQSDLYQKMSPKERMELDFRRENKLQGELTSEQLKTIEERTGKLSAYNDPTAHFRMIREEVKKAAQDGKSKLQFPTGETAMKIEGLGDTTTWRTAPAGEWHDTVTPQSLKVGMEVYQNLDNNAWIITDVLGDGKFKAIAKDKISSNGARLLSEGKDRFDLPGTDSLTISNYAETFDISGKVDQNNPIYKFYEKEVGKYLKNKYGATLVTDPQGVKWWEVPVKKEWKDMPVEAFGIAGAVGLAKFFPMAKDKKEATS